MSKTASRFEELVAWQKARALVREVYRLSSQRAFSSDFALRDQIRRAAISVPSNIAEGFERWHRTEFRRFLTIARASCAELRTQLYIANDVGYITDKALSGALAEAEEVARIIGKLHGALGRTSSPTQHSALSTQHP
jgi:four helix bundle protein